MLILFTIIGSIGSFLIPIPQAKKAYFVSTKGVSAYTYIGLFTTAILFIPHGINTDQPFLSVAHFFSAIFTSIIIYSLVRDNKNKKLWFYQFFISLIFLILYIFGVLILRIIIFMVLSLCLRIPQLLKAIHDKNIEGISIHTWIFAGFSNAGWAGAAAIHHDLVLSTFTIFNILFSVVLITIVSVRRRKFVNGAKIVV
jgi:hypothetical protein